MRTHRDRCHHHPRVLVRSSGGWQWECACGSHSTHSTPMPWRAALIEALAHSTLITP